MLQFNLAERSLVLSSHDNIRFLQPMLFSCRNFECTVFFAHPRNAAANPRRLYAHEFLSFRRNCIVFILWSGPNANSAISFGGKESSSNTPWSSPLLKSGTRGNLQAVFGVLTRGESSSALWSDISSTTSHRISLNIIADKEQSNRLSVATQVLVVSNTA